jgi:hypothetical protein
MQRKVIGFLYLALENEVYGPQYYEKFVEDMFASVPIIHSMCYTNLAKIFKWLFKGMQV